MEFPLLGERARVRASQFSNCIVPAWGESGGERDARNCKAARNKIVPVHVSAGPLRKDRCPPFACFAGKGISRAKEHWPPGVSFGKSHLREDPPARRSHRPLPARANAQGSGCGQAELSLARRRRFRSAPRLLRHQGGLDAKPRPPRGGRRPLHALFHHRARLLAPKRSLSSRSAMLGSW